MLTSSNSEIHIEYSPAIKEKITGKKKLRKLWQTKRCPILKNKLNRAIKTFKNLLKKNQEIQEYLSKLSATLETNYSLWKARKRLKRPQTHHSPIRKQDGSWARSEKEKAEKSSFSISLKLLSLIRGSFHKRKRIGYSLTTPLLPHWISLQDPFSVNEIKAIIKHLNPKKAPSYDLIINQVLQKLPEMGIKYIIQLCNAILRRGYFLPQWKVAQI